MKQKHKLLGKLSLSKLLQNFLENVVTGTPDGCFPHCHYIHYFKRVSGDLFKKTTDGCFSHCHYIHYFKRLSGDLYKI